MPTAHRLVGELVAWGALTDLGRRLRHRPAAVGRRAARTAADRAASRLASPYPPRPVRAPRWPPCTWLCATGPRCSTSTGSPGGTLGADRQHGRLPAADARDRRRQGAARLRTRLRCSEAVLRRPAADHAVHGHPARTPARPARPGTSATGTPRPSEEMSLGACSVAVPIRRRDRGRGRPRHRRAEPQTRPAAAGGRAPGRVARSRPRAGVMAQRLPDPVSRRCCAASRTGALRCAVALVAAAPLDDLEEHAADASRCRSAGTRRRRRGRRGRRVGAAPPPRSAVRSNRAARSS